MSGSLWLLAGWRFGFTAQTVFAVAFFYVLLILSWIDIDTMRLPNTLVGLLAVVGLAGAVFAQVSGTLAVPLIGLGTLDSSPLVAAVLGALMAAVPALLLSLVMAAVLKRPALGMGDVKLLWVIGVFLGFFGLMVLFVGSLVGVVFALAGRVRNGYTDATDSAEGGESLRELPYRAARYVGSSSGDASADADDVDEGDETPLRFSGDDVFPFGPALAAGAVIVTLVGPQLWAWYQSLFTM